jgi:uncharacterized protein
MKRESQHQNALIHASSPYLLQHAHNPVNWMPWGDDARKKALSENKLMLVSIGYSACHWCHVMERESFEDEEVAKLMNKHFVCVKVDREERPDVDHVYMEAVQSMSGQGGWPLNCFTTPDGKPVYGGTYYPKAQWMNVLKQLADMWHDQPEEVQAYGDRLSKGMEVSGGIALRNADARPSLEAIHGGISHWKERFDTRRGGPNKAPKFPLPCNYSFLLHYAFTMRDAQCLKQVELTLDAMCRGGIYDQVGGGFARYSVDAEWKVPHFEKMLYDNAQLLGLYAEAFGAFRKKEYAETARGIKHWLQREMRNGAGGYYSAMDADSEGVEGLYYTWTPEEVSGQSELASAYAKWYHTDQRALWEERLIPVRRESFATTAEAHGKTVEEVMQELRAFNHELLHLRARRVRPATDDKTICSWNAMLASGYALSARYLNESDDLREAKTIMAFIDREMTDGQRGTLYHTWKNGKASINGFLEDYAFYIEACLNIYHASFEAAWLHKAKGMAMLALDHFYDEAKGLFFYTPQEQTDLIVRPVELNDNVIPSSNAVMAHNLSILSSYFGLTHFREKAERLLQAVEKSMEEYTEGYARWADLLLQLGMGAPEVVLTGPQAESWLPPLQQAYLPLLTWAVEGGDATLSIFEGRLDSDVTRAYICKHHSCQRPAERVEEAAVQIKKLFASL